MRARSSVAAENGKLEFLEQQHRSGRLEGRWLLRLEEQLCSSHDQPANESRLRLLLLL